MSERERTGLEYDSPSEYASSAIGPVLESNAVSTVDLPNTRVGAGDDTATIDTIDSAAIGPVLETPSPAPSGVTQDSMKSTTSEVTERVANGSRRSTQGEPVEQTGEDGNESEDADEEQSSDEGGEEESGDDGEEDGEDEEDDEDDDEEEEEPVLKYSKIEQAAADILEKDAASAIAIGATYFAVGTHNGLVHLFTLRGAILKSYRPHSASITDICISTSPPSDTSTTSTNSQFNSPDILITDTIATTSLDGHAILHTLRTGTTTGHNFKRPLRSIALSPSYASSLSSTSSGMPTGPAKAYVCGGMAGDLVLTSRSPTLGQSLGLGNLESILTFGLATGNTNTDGGGSQVQKTLHSGDGPIWIVRWHGDVIAWVVDAGVRLHSVSKGDKIAFIQRERESPRADLFQCSLTWRNMVGKAGEDELLIGWADLVKVVRVRTRAKVTTSTAQPATGVAGLGLLAAGGGGSGAGSGTVETLVEVTKVLRLDCMVAGAVYWPFFHDQEEKEATAARIATSTTATVTTDTSSTGTPTQINPNADSTHRSSFTKPKPPILAKTSAPSKTAQQTAFLLLAYLPTKAMLSAESNADQRRQASNPPELRIVNSTGEERSRDVLALRGVNDGDVGITASPNRSHHPEPPRLYPW